MSTGGHTLRLHALCLSDAGKNDEALQVATNAHRLCSETLPSLGVLMVKLKSHISALSGKKESGMEQWVHLRLLSMSVPGRAPLQKKLQ